MDSKQSFVAGKSGLVLIAGLAIGAVASPSIAGIIPVLPTGQYVMLNHPDGNAVPPPYGFRADNLFSSGIYTFDFEAPGALMVLTITDTGGGTYTFNMSGTAFGGKDIGGGYSADPNDTSVINLDFTYTLGVRKSNDDDYVVLESQGAGSGTLTWKDTGQVIPLSTDAQGGTFFRLGDEDNDSGHRGFVGVSGWGWVDHPNLGGGTGDWLFTVRPIPAPASSMLAIGALAAAGRRRRH